MVPMCTLPRGHVPILCSGMLYRPLDNIKERPRDEESTGFCSFALCC